MNKRDGLTFLSVTTSRTVLQTVYLNELLTHDLPTYLSPYLSTSLPTCSLTCLTVLVTYTNLERRPMVVSRRGGLVWWGGTHPDGLGCLGNRGEDELLSLSSSRLVSPPRCGCVGDDQDPRQDRLSSASASERVWVVRLRVVLPQVRHPVLSSGGGPTRATAVVEETDSKECKVDVTLDRQSERVSRSQ